MAYAKFLIFLVSAVFVSCDSAFVDALIKCGINDAECQRVMFKTALVMIGNTGDPEHGIPPLDPMVIQNVNVVIPDIVNITLVDGALKGVKNCDVTKNILNIKEGNPSMDLLCDITIKGHYQVFSSNPLIKNLFGGETVNGDGKVKIKIEDLKLSLDYYNSVVKRGNDYFIVSKSFDTSKYTYDIGKMTFAANNLCIGKKDASANIVKVMNENWKLVMGIGGKPFMDKAMESIYHSVQKVFSNIPAKDYLIDDVSPYAVS